MKPFMCSGFLLLLLAACASKSPSDTSYRPTATVKDIMDSMVDPNADFVWNSVATIVDAEGEHERFPQTDEEWNELRRHTIALLEATNLLLIPGRHIARPGEKAENPNVELSPEEIEALVNKDRASWIRLAHGLHDSVALALKAVDARDKEGIMTAGGGIQDACESCHQKYWYPNDTTGLKRY